MIKQLVEGQEAVTRTARGIFPLLDKVSDEPTADLLTQRMQVHEKTAWMLRAAGRMTRRVEACCSRALRSERPLACQ